jgi:kinesin family protein C2/C3
LLRAKALLAAAGISVSFTAQFVEIYEEQVTDLFTGQPATVRRDTGNVAGALEMPFDCMAQVVDALRTGHERKKFAATEMNDRSSRSHTALIIHVTQKLAVELLAQCAQEDRSGRCASLLGCMAAGGDKLIRSQLHLVDLAGSERVKKSKVEGLRLREAVGINSSLLVGLVHVYFPAHFSTNELIACHRAVRSWER